MLDHGSDGMLIAEKNKFSAVMVQRQHKKQVQLRQNGDRNRRHEPHSMSTVFGSVSQSL